MTVFAYHKFLAPHLGLGVKYTRRDGGNDRILGLVATCARIDTNIYKSLIGGAVIVVIGVVGVIDPLGLDDGCDQRLDFLVADLTTICVLLITHEYFNLSRLRGIGPGLLDLMVTIVVSFSTARSANG